MAGKHHMEGSGHEAIGVDTNSKLSVIFYSYESYIIVYNSIHKTIGMSRCVYQNIPFIHYPKNIQILSEVIILWCSYAHLMTISIYK